jgi:hypothetical protein
MHVTVVDGVHQALDVGIGGQQDATDARVERPHLGEQLGPEHGRHPIVAHDDRDRRPEGGARLGTRVGGHDGCDFAKRSRHRREPGAIVVHTENGIHLSTLRARIAARERRSQGCE